MQAGRDVVDRRGADSNGRTGAARTAGQNQRGGGRRDGEVGVGRVAGFQGAHGGLQPAGHVTEFGREVGAGRGCAAEIDDIRAITVEADAQAGVGGVGQGVEIGGGEGAAGQRCRVGQRCRAKAGNGIDFDAAIGDAELEHAGGVVALPGRTRMDENSPPVPEVMTSVLPLRAQVNPESAALPPAWA
jgi:hypothetical protein